MTDEELIAKGRELAIAQEEARVRIGQLALEFAPILAVGGKGAVYARLELYAEEIGVETMTLNQWRVVAHHWRDVDAAGDFGYTVLHHCLGVSDKPAFLDALAATEPPTKCGRWTVKAAVAFARANGFMGLGRKSREADPEDVIGILKRTRHSIARLTEYEWNDLQAEALMSELNQLALEITMARETMRKKLPQKV